MSNYTHDSIKPYLEEGGSKKEQVARMFNQISSRYDLLNRFLSWGIDAGWRKKAIRQLKSGRPETVLDVATGTGDMAILARGMLGAKRIVGIDISEGMLGEGRKKIAERGLQDIILLQSGDSEHISFAADSFDAATVAFGVRNFSDLEQGLSEMLRVLRPGGRIVILELSQPESALIKPLYTLYTRLIGEQAGRLIAKNKDAYRYLNDSVSAFPEGAAFLRIMDKVGYRDSSFKKLSFGMCTIYCGSK